MSKRKVPKETEGSRSNEKVPLKIRINGKPTTIHIPIEVKKNYWPAFQEISKIHFRKSASQMITDFVIGVVMQHMENPQSSLNSFIEKPDIPALPTIGRGHSINWSLHKTPTLLKVMDDTDKIAKRIRKELKKRDLGWIQTKKSPMATDNPKEAEELYRYAHAKSGLDEEEIEQRVQESMKVWRRCKK